jgi:pimeloyl-ACP methyl ester carboxylesterase
MWLPVAERVAASYRVILPDLRGFGLNREVLPEDAVLTMEQHADDLAALLDFLAIDEPITLAGLSMGGYIALAFWRRHRQRLGKLVLCDTRAAADTPEAAKNRHTLAARVLSEGSHVAADAMLPKLFAAETPKTNPEIVAKTRQVIVDTLPTSIAAALRGMAQRPDMRAELPNINVPTLVICGAEDAITPPDEMQSMAAAMPQASYVEIAGAGHMAPLERPEETARSMTNVE